MLLHAIRYRFSSTSSGRVVYHSFSAVSAGYGNLSEVAGARAWRKRDVFNQQLIMIRAERNNVAAFVS